MVCKMNKFFSIVLSIISLVISLIIAILWFCNVKNVSIVDPGTFMSVSVGVLSVLVTFVLGWQIFNVIDVREKIMEVSKFQKEIEIKQTTYEKKLQQTESKIIERESLTLYAYYRIVTKHEIENKNFQIALYLMMQALLNRCNFDKFDSIDEHIETLDRQLNAIKIDQKDISPEVEKTLVKLDKAIRETKYYDKIKLFYEKYWNSLPISNREGIK